MKITKNLLTVNQYSRPGTKRTKTTKLAVHWVGNANSTAIANRNYFESLKDKKIYASSHYIIGLQGEIIQCVPEDEIAYTTNEANAYSIGIECCHPDWTGKFNDKTYKAMVELFADLCKRYKLDPIKDIIRHYDISKKVCPKYFVDYPKEFEKFKNDVKAEMQGEGAEYKVTKAIVIINGVEKEVNVINVDGNNFIKLQDLRDDKIVIGYDATKKTPTITTK